MPIPVLAAVGAGVSGLAGLIGNAIASGDRAEAQRILADAYEQYGDVVFEELGPLLPQILGESQVSQVQTDPALKAAQMRSLDALRDIETEGGLLMEDRAALNELTQDAERAASGRQANIVENLAARGGLNSGAALSAQLSNAQAGAQRANQRALTTAGQAQRRVLDSIMSGGRLAGDIRGQGFQEDVTKARAADEIARWNAQQRGDVARFNQDSTRYNNQLKATASDRKLRQAENLANIRAGNAAQTQQLASGIGSAANAGFASVAAYQDAEEERKRGR